MILRNLWGEGGQWRKQECAGGKEPAGQRMKGPEQPGAPLSSPSLHSEWTALSEGLVSWLQSNWYNLTSKRYTVGQAGPTHY